MKQQLINRLQKAFSLHKADMLLVVGEDIFLPLNRSLAKDHAAKNGLKVQEVRPADIEQKQSKAEAENGQETQSEPQSAKSRQNSSK